MTEQNNALSQEEMDFKAWHKAAWEEVEQFYESPIGGLGREGRSFEESIGLAVRFSRYLGTRR